MAQQAIPPANNTISLARLIDFILQRTYHELTVLAELLPRKTDMERKIEIVQFASRTRQLFIRLLALVKWAASASKVEKCASIMSFLDKQSMLFVEMADMLSVMSRDTLVNARLPSFHLPCAVEVLTLGTYSRLPTCIRDKIVPPDPITPAEKRATLLRLNQIIQYRLVSSELPPQMRNLTIENGRVTFYVEHEFEVSLTLMGDSPLVSWRLLDIDILVEDKETGDGEALVHSLQINYIHQLIQSRLIDNPKPLHELYNCLHSFCQSLQLEVLHSQVLRLCRDRLRDFIVVEEYTAGSRLVLCYWRFPYVFMDKNSFLNRLPKFEENTAERESNNCKLCVQMDPTDPSRPLQVTHVPHLNHKDAQLADQAIKSDFLSVEKLLIHTVHIRTKHKLQELSEILKPLLGLPECTISGSPAVLHCPILQPCMISEELLITVNTHTGHFLAHVPQFEPPMMDDIQNCLNKDPTKVENLISELRFWITVRRCEKTIQHLPATASEHLPLIIQPDHELNKFSKHKLYIKLCRHQEYYIIVRLLENPSNRCEILPAYYLMTVSPQPLEDDTIDQKVETTVMDTELPKTYLKIVDFSPLDSFIATHGPGTEMEYDHQGVGKKRRLMVQSDTGVKKVKYTGFFISELAHIVAMCDERIPYSALSRELNKKDVCHNGIQIEAHGSNYQVKIVQLPVPDVKETETFNALHSALLSCTIRLNGKGARTWFVEFVFCNCPVPSVCPKEQGPCRALHYTYDFGAGTNKQVAEMVEEMLKDWCIMGHLYKVVLDFAQALKCDQHNMFPSIMEIKSFTYKRLVIGYGPNKANMVNIYWNPCDKRYHLGFGVVGQTVSASNPHTIVAAQLQHEFNQHLSVMTLMQCLHETYAPLLTINKLPTASELGVVHSRPALPIQTFVIMPQTSTHFRVIYRNMFCLDIECRPEGLVAVRDGAYSVFDKQKAVEELSTINSIKAFLSKFVDETATQARRRSQTEEDSNPLSPVPTLDSLDSGFLSVSSQVKPGSPAQSCRGQDSGSGLRFHLPMTPPSGSNPHTPASPHTSVLSQQGYGASPNPSFSLASPPSLGSQSQQHVSPSPSILHVQAQSPGNLFSANSPANPLHAPSPSFLPTPSPSQVTMQSPATSFIGQQSHGDAGSPFAAPASAGNLSMSSPAPGAWPGSPSVPRPSPRPTGTAQSPGSSSHPALHSPQAGGLSDHSKTSGVSSGSSRVLHCSWQAGTPTLLTHKSFDQLCSPGPLTGNQVHTSPLERFLGCCYMRKSLGRVIQSENMVAMPTNEVGVTLFKAETLQCRVSLNPQTLQSLHLKLAPTPEFKDQWTQDELQVIERYFDAKVVSIPYKPNALLAFGRILNAPLRIFKDCIHIMHLEMVPDRSLKWAIQWCLTIPPAAPQIAPPGMSAIVMVKDRMLFFAQLTRIGLNLAPGVEPQSVVFAAVYDIKMNTTTVPDNRRDAMPISPTDPVYIITNMLKRFAEYNPNPNECSIYPAIRELLTNLVVPI
ncbi:mediator of RNA polymerase II transcription subunit 14-like isoform X1 [Argiope bruennichi]|uniref:mediator of RNA polymerase II transcription subunit 14-like isoform X1 n=1 Tax=Argiope bruennichi TaxID=94029 RepID=UPI0024947E66|nr:mediator of RNA polymerase II transcription subunit 14-like isoform X1 [Argiope bruennichi]XP_055926041.1 mediator of RNA polymerase II transcription subunit 14-like isoform X1 [Argiope bruennichi]